MLTAKPRSTTRYVTVLASAALLLGACSSDPAAAPTTAAEQTTSSAGSPADVTPVVDPGDGGRYRPNIDAADFVATIDNPYLPLLPGGRWRYEGTSEGEPEEIEVTVLDETRSVMGVPVVVVRDTVTVDGALKEDTIDWFAQDREGNVWYFGEEVEDYENGKVVSTAGSWEAGVDGAVPGIVMPADPQNGRAYRQEFFAGEAEDMFEVLSTDHTTSAAGTAYDQVVKTEDWSPLEPETVEHKYYARGIGKVREDKVRGGRAHVELVSHTPGSAD